MKPLLLAVCALLLTGCADRSERIAPGVLIYRSGASTPCDVIEISRTPLGDVSTIICRQSDGWFRVRPSDVSGIKRLTRRTP